MGCVVVISSFLIGGDGSIFEGRGWNVQVPTKNIKIILDVVVRDYLNILWLQFTLI